MTGIRKGENAGPVAVPRLAAKNGGPGADTNTANRKPRAAQRTIEFPQRPTLDDVISERIVFEVGNTRFAVKWSAEIEQLPPAGPVAVERKKRLNSHARPQVRR
jgi:hypothetical protein